MDPAKIRRDLQQADEHIRIGAAEIEKQRHIVKTLKADGHDTRMARTLLRTFERLQETHLAGRNTIARELVYAEHHGTNRGGR